MYVIQLIFILLTIMSSFFVDKIDFLVQTEFNLDSLNRYEKVFIQNDDQWSLSIPKLNLNNIIIKDGVESDILENYIGHFPISSYVEGNVCLAAHNNGFKNNYFENLYKINKNDYIYYRYNNIEKVYKVDNISIISEDDFSCLNIDDKDRLTLITCISNSPQERLCIQAICEE